MLDLKISGSGVRSVVVRVFTLVSSVFSSSASSSVNPGGSVTRLPAEAPISAGTSDREPEPRLLFGEFRLMSVCKTGQTKKERDTHFFRSLSLPFPKTNRMSPKVFSYRKI